MRDGALIFHTEGVFSYPGYGRMLVARVILSFHIYYSDKWVPIV